MITPEEIEELVSEMYDALEEGKVISLQWQWDEKKKVAKKNRHYGKNVLYTNRLEVSIRKLLNPSISDARIVRAYRSQAKLELLFRISKSRRPGLWWPAYHWTDSKLRVHALTCFLALVLLKVFLIQLEKASISIGVENLIERTNTGSKNQICKWFDAASHR